MKPINGTNLHRRLISKPNIVPLFNILLIFIYIFMIIPAVPGCKPCFELHETGNGKLIHIREELLNIYIDIDHRVFFRSEKLDNLSNLTLKIEDFYEENGIISPKVALRIHKDVDFGTVQQVMRLVEEAGVQKVTLITSYYISLSDVMTNNSDVRDK